MIPVILTIIISLIVMTYSVYYLKVRSPKDTDGYIAPMVRAMTAIVAFTFSMIILIVLILGLVKTLQ